MQLTYNLHKSMATTISLEGKTLVEAEDRLSVKDAYKVFRP